MSVLRTAVLTMVVLISPSGAAQGQAKHPNLLLSRQELAEMKVRRDTTFCNSGAGFLGLGRPALACGRPHGDAPPPPPPAPSSLLPEAGLAMLRADQQRLHYNPCESGTFRSPCGDES